MGPLGQGLRDWPHGLKPPDQWSTLLVVKRPAEGRQFKPSSRHGEFSSSCRGLEENCLPEPSLKLKSVDLASAEEEEDLMVSKGKERAMKLTSLHTLPHGQFIVRAGE